MGGLILGLASCSPASKKRRKHSLPDQEFFAEPTLSSLRSSASDEPRMHTAIGAATVHARSLNQEAMHEYLARHADIPIPLHAFAFGQSDQTHEQSALYYSYPAIDIQELVCWYEQEMEMSGWIQTAHVDSDEIVLAFDKPERFCIVSIKRPLKKSAQKQLKVSVFSGKKRSVE